MQSLLNEYFDLRMWNGTLGLKVFPSSFYDIPALKEQYFVVSSSLPSFAILDVQKLEELKSHRFLSAMTQSPLFLERATFLFNDKNTFAYELYALKKQFLFDLAPFVSDTKQQSIDEFYLKYPKLHQCLMYWACFLKKANSPKSWPERLRISGSFVIEDFDVRKEDMQFLRYAFYELFCQHPTLEIVTEKDLDSYSFSFETYLKDIGLDIKEPFVPSWLPSANL